MESTGFFRLECLVKRRNRMVPCVFLIDAGKEPALACVFNPRTGESLDHRKVSGPRPLKTHSYNFAYIESRDGRPLVEKRAANRHDAEGFARAILENASPLSREEYLEQLGSIIWPPQWAKEELAPAAMMYPEWKDFHPSLEMPRSHGKRDALPADPPYERMHLLFSAPPEVRKAPGRPSNERKLIIREMMRLMESMDLEDLRELIRFSRMLLED